MNKDSHLHIFIGYDERQSDAWDVCAFSLRRTASRPLSIHKLDHRLVRNLGLFNRSWTVEGDTGRAVDASDGKPFSTQFAHSRFLVPEFCKYLGASAGDCALFVDSDFVFLDDPYSMVLEASQGDSKPVHVVKHNYVPKAQVKMDNQVQTTYNMKLWSSCMLFDLSYPTRPTIKEVNENSGRWLHTFEWLNGEHEIGTLDERWNFIPDHSEDNVLPNHIGAIHYTEGLPTLPGYEYCRYADVWNSFHREALKDRLKRGEY